MPRDKIKPDRAKRVYPFVVWKVILGGVLIIPAIFFGAIYIKNPLNYYMALALIAFLLPAGYLIYSAFSKMEFGHNLSKKQAKGNENCLIWFARRNPDTGRDIPYKLLFLRIEPKHIPRTARPKYLRNLGRHVYELTWNTTDKKLEPTILPDKKPLTPQLFVLPATMQPFKDWHDFSPASMMQKLAPGLMILVMIVIGVLMVVTGPQPGV